MNMRFLIIQPCLARLTPCPIVEPPSSFLFIIDFIIVVVLASFFFF